MFLADVGDYYKVSVLKKCGENFYSWMGVVFGPLIVMQDFCL